ncbi:hypothetical protein GOV11_02960 [Candidatus Woesearchaeota archaeon]|nr:hypothetical protein [Candidatus Woesearchaeota archaeon]
MKVLNSKERKRVRQDLEAQYGFSGDLDYGMLLKEKKQKISLITKKIDEITLDGVRVDTLGMYFAAYFNGKLRLSIEGSQMIGDSCSKNVVDISKKQMQGWIQGEKLEAEEFDNLPDEGSFVIIRHEKDYIGCGKVSQGAVTNYIPKSRYVHALY